MDGNARGFRVVHLNYNHLHYFWVVASVGSIARAAKSLHVTPQTISGQLRTLEERLGSPLFRRVGRQLALTETGQIVHSYVDPMFSLGLELGDVLEKRSPRRPSPLSIGIATNVSKSIACRVLRPALDNAARARFHEASSDLLLAAVVARDLDLAVTDGGTAAAHPPSVRSHLIGQCGVSFLCSAAYAERYRARFPQSLDGAPIVLPARTSALHRSLTDWFRLKRVAPSIVAEIDSPEFASTVCEDYGALFALPTMLAHEAERRYRVSAVGEAVGVEQHYYVVCGERSARRDDVQELIENARKHFRAAGLPIGGGAGRTPEPWRLPWLRRDAISAELAEAAGQHLAAVESS